MHIHPNISSPYVLVTHNCDLGIPNDPRKANELEAGYDYAAVLTESKILAWFGQNPNLIHHKIIPVPIGFSNPKWGYSDGSHYRSLAPLAPDFLSPNRDCLLYAHFGGDNPEREKLKAHFDWATWPVGRSSHKGFLEKMTRCKFVLSPPGNGIDCHRTWEAMAMGAIPIVQRFPPMDPLYANAPVLIVDKFTDVTQTLLQEFQLPETLDFSAMWARTHLKRIRKFKDVPRSDFLVPHTSENCCNANGCTTCPGYPPVWLG